MSKLEKLHFSSRKLRLGLKLNLSICLLRLASKNLQVTFTVH